MANAMTVALEGGAPELEIAADIARRGLYTVPVFLIGAGLAEGLSGSVSAGFALALVLGNFLLAARIMATAARISLAALYGAVLGGYLLRLTLITAAFFAVKGMAWFEILSFSFTLVVTHLGLLIWETRYVSATLAHPGLKPGPPVSLSTQGAHEQ